MRLLLSRLAVLLTVGALVLGGQLAVAQDSDVFILRERTPAPPFSLPDLSGRGVNSTAFAGKVAILSFGATWCPTCTSEVKSLESLQAKFPKDLAVYFIAFDGRGDKDVKPYMEKSGYTIATLLDPKMVVAREHGIRWIPVTLVVDRNGVVVGRAIGPREWDGKEALEFIQPLIKR